MTVSFRIFYRKLGGHYHARVGSSEFGPDTTHGLNGTLVLRESEWPAFRLLLEAGQHARIGHPGEGDDVWSAPPFAVVEFVDETEDE